VPVVVSSAFTPEGRSALRAAGSEALRRRTGLVLVRTEREGMSADDPDAEGLEAVRGEVESELAAAGLAYELRSVDGGDDPAGVLLSVAEEVDAELIVIGLRRRTPVGKLILGVNAQRILLDAPCAVLAVKAPYLG